MARTNVPAAPARTAAPGARPGAVRAPVRRSMAERMQRHTSAAVGKGNSSLDLPTGLEIWRPDKVGSFTMDFLPYLVTKAGHPDEIDLGETINPGETWYRRPYAVHYLEQRRILCPRFTFGQPCPICEANDALRKEDYNKNKDAIKELNPKKNVLFIIRLKGEKIFRLFDWNNSKFAEVLEKEMNASDDPSVYSFAELANGKTLTVRIIEETYAGKKFLQCDRIDFRTRGDVPEAVLKTVPKLDELFKPKSYDEIARLFSADGSDVAVEDEPAPPMTEAEAPNEPPETGEEFQEAEIPSEWGEETGAETTEEGEAVCEECGNVVSACTCETDEEREAREAAEEAELQEAAAAKAKKPAPAAKAPPAKAPAKAPAAKAPPAKTAAEDDNW